MTETSNSRSSLFALLRIGVFAFVAGIVILVMIFVSWQNIGGNRGFQEDAPQSLLEECRADYDADSTYAVTNSPLLSFNSPHRDDFSVIQPNWSGTITVSGCIEKAGVIYVTGFAHEQNTGYSYAAVYSNSTSTTPTH